ASSTTWTAGSTCEIIGYTTNATTPTNIGGQTFANFTWNCQNQQSTITLGSTFNTVTGNFSIITTGSANLQLSGAATTLTISGDYNQPGGTFIPMFGTGSMTMTINVGG